MSQQLPEDARLRLEDLQAHSPDDANASDLFDTALKRFGEAGWTYRQLAESLGVSRFYINTRINRAVHPGGPELGFDIPTRIKPLTVLPALELPATMREDLIQRLLQAIDEHPTDRTPHGLNPVVSSYFDALAAATEAGWDAHSIGTAIGVHPRTVSRFTAYRAQHPTNIDYPPAPAIDSPLAWNAKHPAVAPPTIPAVEAAELQQLAAAANLNRGAGKADSPAMEQATEYTTRLAGWYLRGASREQLEKATGQGWEALRKRLARWGYMASASKN